VATIELHEVAGLVAELKDLRARVEVLEAERGDGWVRGSAAIGRYLGLSSTALRTRKLLGDLDGILVQEREGGPYFARRADLDAYLRRAA
jgi:hypothetical protein